MKAPLPLPQDTDQALLVGDVPDVTQRHHARQSAGIGQWDIEMLTKVLSGDRGNDGISVQQIIDQAAALGYRVQIVLNAEICDSKYPPAIDIAEIGTLVTNERLARDMSMAELAAAARLSVTGQLWDLERSAYSKVHAEVLACVLDTLSLTTQCVPIENAPYVALPGARPDYEINFVNEQLYRFAEMLDEARASQKIKPHTIAAELGLHHKTVDAILSPRYETHRAETQLRMPLLKNILDVAAYLGHELFIREFGGCPNLDEANTTSLTRVLDSSTFHLGDFLIERRKEAKLSMPALSAATGGVNRRIIMRLERNEHIGVQFGIFATILKQLRLELDCRPSTVDQRYNLDFRKTLP